MKVVYNLIKLPLIYTMIGFFIIESIIFLTLFFTFHYFLYVNEEIIKKTLISQSDEVFNSISFLINSIINSVSSELLLFNQTINIKQKYDLTNSKYNSEEKICDIENSRNVISENIEDIEGKERSEKIQELLNNNYLNKISLYFPDTDTDFDSLLNEFKLGNIYYTISFLKSIFIKNIISNQNKEKLNYTLYINDLIFFYPSQNINEKTLINLPFYKQDVTCKFTKYNFDCSSIPDYTPIDDDLNLYNSIIHMDLKLSLNNLYINTCLNTNLKIYKDNTKEKDNSKKFICIASNLTDILEDINYDSNYFLFNIIQYNKENDGIKLLYSSNNNIYKDISLNKKSDKNLFSSDEYNKYQLKKNSEENIADLFHALYYEIEKYINHFIPKEEIMKEYEENIKEIKEVIKNKDSNKNNIIIKKEVNQSFIYYKYNNNGKIDYNSSYIKKDEFMYILRPIVTDSVKIVPDLNIIDRNVSKIILYTLTVIKLTKPKNSLAYTIHNYISSRILFYSLTFEFFGCILIYLFLFFLMRCILNPFKIFKASIEKLLDNDIKNKKDQIKDKEYFDKRQYENQSQQKINSLENDKSINYQQIKYKTEKQKIDMIKKDYMRNYLKSRFEVKHQYTNLEMKEIEKIISFLQKILLLRDTNTPYQARADFYQSISSEISKKYQLDLFKCQLLIGEYYIKDKQYSKAKKELENFQVRLEQCRAEYINKDKFIEKKNAFISTYNDFYINDYTNKESIKNDKFINLEMITENFHYLMGLTNYFLFLELKHKKKEILNEYSKQKVNNGNKNLIDIISKNFNVNINNINNSGIDINSHSNKLTTQMDHYLEKAVKHFKESYKINNTFKINQIKNIIILVYLSNCYMELSNKSIDNANKVLKKAFLSLSNFNKVIIELTDSNASNIQTKKFNNKTNFLLYKNLGLLVSQVVKKSYIDSRVMLIINGSLLQMILYQIGKMALKLHKIKPAYFCFVKLIQSSYFKNEYIHFRAIKWIRSIINKQINKGKKQLGFTILQFHSKRRFNNFNSINAVDEEESYIKKSSIEYMKSYIKNLIEIFEKNKYKRREKKISKELLSFLEKKIDYSQSSQRNMNSKKRSRLNSRALNYFKLDQSQNSLSSSNKDLNQSIDTPRLQVDNSTNSPNKKNDNRSISPNNNNQNKNIEESIPRSEYIALTKPFIIKDLLIAQIVHSPIKIKEEEKIFKNIEKQYYRLNKKKKANKCLIIILSELFLENFSSLKSFHLFLQYCLTKYLEDKDKIGYIFYSFSVGTPDKFYELEYKEKALRKLDELFLNLNILNKNKKSLKKKKLLTDSFDIAMDMFNNEQLNNDYDMEIKNDKYIFCFGTLSSLRYKCFEASFSQTNRINYMEVSLYYFVFDSIDNYKNKIQHYKKYFKKFIEGFLIFVENFKLIKLCFANICFEGKQKNLFSNKLECIKNII